MKGYMLYKKVLDKKKNNFMEKLKYWDRLKKSYNSQLRENARKEEENHNLTIEINELKEKLKNANKKNK